MRFRLWRWFRRKCHGIHPPSDPARRAISVLLYKRNGCHLCDDAIQLLRKFEAEFRLHIETFDIDHDAEMIARYGEKVPVIQVQGRERFFGPINEPLLLRLLRAERDKLDKV